jgi:hypothetical protein
VAGSTLQTNPYDLYKLLGDCHRGVLQLPDFQRSWVWDEDRIKSLIASVSRAFPVGALMTLDSGGPVNFKPRPVEGAPAEAKHSSPQSLLLDGQQRMTSLYQVTLRGKVVETATPQKKKVKRWFYIDIRKALDESADREEAIVGVPEDRVVRTDFGRGVAMDLSSPEKEYDTLMYPVAQVFDWDNWQDGFDEHWQGDANKIARDTFRAFKKQVLENFKGFFGENVDIHHIFPQDWCKKQGIKPSVFDSIINKTPLSFRTNRIIGGVAPSEYVAKLQKGDSTTPAIAPANLDTFLCSHLIDPDTLRRDRFDVFMADRQKRLLRLIEQATGKPAYAGEIAEEGEDVQGDEDSGEAEMTITS